MDSTIFAILVALAEGRRSASTLLESLEATGGGRAIAVATFYRRLNLALDSGWVAGHEEGVSGRGRPGKQYALTEAGGAAMRAEAHRLQHLAGLALRGEASR